MDWNNINPGKEDFFPDCPLAYKLFLVWAEQGLVKQPFDPERMKEDIYPCANARFPRDL